MNEIPLSGGRVTQGVVRVGDTVRRPLRANSEFVRTMLAHLQERGFGATPQYLGSDEQGREIFSFVEGDVPPDLSPDISDESLAAAAQLIRRFHDATADTALARGEEVVCHNDLSPCNFVFRAGAPVAMIDFDAAAPGTRLQDIGMALFLWLNLGTDRPDLTEQARRISLFCRSYGTAADAEVVQAIIVAVTENVDRLQEAARNADAEWWQEQAVWLAVRQEELARLIGKVRFLKGDEA
jgi:Ser/Thr protein kinase RdoA (MazF antagonist)